VGDGRVVWVVKLCLWLLHHIAGAHSCFIAAGPCCTAIGCGVVSVLHHYVVMGSERLNLLEMRVYILHVVLRNGIYIHRYVRETFCCSFCSMCSVWLALPSTLQPTQLELTELD
jgi:hypothetical protein